MAHAEQTVLIVTRVVDVEEKVVILSLTPDEALALARVTYFVGGNPATTRRRHISAIQAALHKSGIYGSRDADGQYDDMVGEVTFR